MIAPRMSALTKARKVTVTAFPLRTTSRVRRRKGLRGGSRFRRCGDPAHACPPVARRGSRAARHEKTDLLPGPEASRLERSGEASSYMRRCGRQSTSPRPALRRSGAPQLRIRAETRRLCTYAMDPTSSPRVGWEATMRRMASRKLAGDDHLLLVAPDRVRTGTCTECARMSKSFSRCSETA